VLVPPSRPGTQHRRPRNVAVMRNTERGENIDWKGGVVAIGRSPLGGLEVKVELPLA
jgi:hypothetical protein